MSCGENQFLSRRLLLQGGASLAFSGLLPRTAVSGKRDPRFLLVILRGGLDGIAVVAPTADPDYQRLRGALALPASGDGAGHRLDGFFALHPGMNFLHQLYRKRQALVVHAAATPYRGRSHFDGQDVLESGLGGKGRSNDGWLNRAIGALPASGAASPRGLSLGAVVPLVMRGPAKVITWTQPVFAGHRTNESTLARLMDLYANTDPELGKALAEGLEVERMAAQSGNVIRTSTAVGGKKRYRVFVDAAARAARFLSAPDGPRIGVLSYNGWDTHFNEGVQSGQLANKLGGLDAAIKALHDNLGSVWADTVIIFATEFGRTARTNGTRGTDHGTASASLMVGGAVNGGRVIADWPGLSDRALFEGRDLQPTLDLRSVFKGVLQDHLGLPARALGTRVFPDSLALQPLSGLIA